MTDIIPTGVLKKHFPNITDYQLYLKRRLFIPDLPPETSLTLM
jgi:hypothetical protein